MNPEQMSRDELLAMLQSLQRARQADQEKAEEKEREHASVFHELQIHQVELEVQNRELREAQSGLEESRNRYAALYDFAPIAYYTFDAKGCIKELNLTATTLLGKDRQQVLGLPFLALVKMENPALFWGHLRRCGDGRKSVVSEFGFLTPSAGMLEVKAISVPVFDPAGNPIAFRTALIDITQLMEAEAERQLALQAEQLLRGRLQALDRANVAVSRALATLRSANARTVLQVVVDQARLLTDAQYAALGVCGAEPGQPFDPWVFSGMGPGQVALIGRFPRAVGMLSSAVALGKTLRLKDLRAHPAFGGFPAHHPQMISFLSVPIVFGDRALGTIFLANKGGDEEFTAEDQLIIELLAARASSAIEVGRLRELEARERDRLRVLAEAGNAMTGTLDPEAVVQAMARLPLPWLADYCVVHLVEGEELRPVAAAHVDPARAQRLAKFHQVFRVRRDNPHSLLARAWTTGQVVLIPQVTSEMAERFFADSAAQLEARALFPKSALIVPIYLRGHVAGTMSLGLTEPNRRYGPEDISHAEEVAHRCGLALDNARLFQESQAAIKARDNLLALVSHDLRSPLSAILLSTGLLARLVSSEEAHKARKTIDNIRRAGEHMHGLIVDLMEAAAIEGGGFTVDPDREDAAVLAEACVHLAEPLSAAKSLALELDLPPQLPALYCDRKRVLRVFGNLVGNAIKFTPAEGSIRIAATCADGRVCFAISDTGCGIPTDALPHLFERYWKTPSSERLGGTGLGLFIAKGIIEAHGGRLWVESQVGVGSTFFFTLPVAD